MISNFQIAYSTSKRDAYHRVADVEAFLSTTTSYNVYIRYEVIGLLVGFGYRIP